MDNLTKNTVLSKSALKTLIYFDLFDYPLTAREVFRHLQFANASFDELNSELDLLTHEGAIYKFNEFYSMQNDPSLETRRRNGNLLAKRFMDKAVHQSQVIAHFPFVEGVMISGSLSKGYADHNSDIDFFIVTKPGRLWIARTLLVMYKRLYLLNSHKYFCVNYFVDREYLEIKEKNIYTATELSTLIPLVGSHAYTELMARNEWIQSYCPNFNLPEVINLPGPEKESGFKRMMEWLFNHFQPNTLDRFLMKLTFRRWKALYGNFEKADFRLAFKTNRHTSKSHSHFYQKKILTSYQERIQSLASSLRIPSAV